MLGGLSRPPFLLFLLGYYLFILHQIINMIEILIKLYGVKALKEAIAAYEEKIALKTNDIKDPITEKDPWDFRYTKGNSTKWEKIEYSCGDCHSDISYEDWSIRICPVCTSRAVGSRGDKMWRKVYWGGRWIYQFQFMGWHSVSHYAAETYTGPFKKLKHFIGREKPFDTFNRS